MRSSRDSFFSLPASKSQISHPSNDLGMTSSTFGQITRPWLGDHSCQSCCTGCQPQALEDDHPPSVGGRFQCSVFRRLQSSCVPRKGQRVLWTPGVEVERSQSNWVRLPKPTSFKKPTEHATQWCWLCWKIELDILSSQHIPPPPKKVRPKNKWRPFCWGLMNHWLRAGYLLVGWPVL